MGSNSTEDNAQAKLSSKTAIESFGENLGIEGFQLDANDSFTLQFDEKISVSGLLEECGDVVLHAHVGTLEFADRTSLYEMLLEANLFWSRTNGGTLAVEASTGAVLLQKRLDAAAVTEERFRAELEKFVNTTETWMGILNQKSNEVPPADFNTFTRL